MAHTANSNYEILGVRQNATLGDIRNAFQTRVKTLHPWEEQDADERWARQQVLDRVTSAYNALVSRRKQRSRAH